MDIAEILRCSQCKKSKPVSDFYRSKARRRGYSYYCKVCDEERSKRWREKGGYKKRRISARNWARSEHGQETHKRYRQSEQGKKNKAKSKRIYKERYPEKCRARKMAQRKIRVEGLCERCKLRKAEHRHHEDYDNPLDVKLLCRKCHGDLHGLRSESG